MPAPDITLNGGLPDVVEREAHWRRIRRRAAIGYVAALLVFIAVLGVPTDRESLLLWVLGALGIRCLGEGWGSFRRVLLDWLPFTGVLVVYDLSRGIADGLGMPIHVSDIAAVERWVCRGVLPTAWLQDHLYVAGDPRWYDGFVSLIYASHFLATPAIAAVLWVRNRERWVAFATRVVMLAFAGLVTYVLLPAAPPWYAAREGVIEPVVRISSRGWYEIGLTRAGQVLSKGQLAVNPVAAVPSLHTAYAALIAVFFWAGRRWWIRTLLVSYAVLMGVVLVYAGEHYVVDVLLGWVYVALVIVGARAFERWRERRKLLPDKSLTSGLGPQL